MAMLVYQRVILVLFCFGGGGDIRMKSWPNSGQKNW